MQHYIGAVLLIAGTCIGSGMIALPLVLATLGIIPSTLLMLFIWSVMYYSSLVNLELNLQAGKGLSLGALSRLFSGPLAEMVSTVCLKLLSYSLLAVFIYGGASIVQEFMETQIQLHYSLSDVSSYYALGAVALLLLPIRFLDYCNRILFLSLLAIVGILIASLLFAVDWSHLPLFSDNVFTLSSWAVVIPVVFTSFGFQVIFHTVANYCRMDALILKRAFLWGSLIPAGVYFLWTFGILGAVYHQDPNYYLIMERGEADVGGLIRVLGSISGSESIQMLVWGISSLAIGTSVLGVGVGLCQSLQHMLERSIPNPAINKTVAAVATILPPYLVVLYVPNAFIAVLGFAGLILALIAIVIPIYLLRCSKKHQYHYSELQNTRWLVITAAVGILVIVCEICHLAPVVFTEEFFDRFLKS